MKIAIHTASASVARALEAAIAAAGHTLTTQAKDAELVLEDMFHPAKTPLPICPSIRLASASSATDADILPCPLRPHRLIQLLTTRSQTQTLALGNGWSLDLLARHLTHADEAATSLTEKECTLLKTLITAQTKALTREDMLEAVWGIAQDTDTHTLETHIYRLRGKLESLTPPPGDILTDSGTYRFFTKD